MLLTLIITILLPRYVLSASLLALLYHLDSCAATAAAVIGVTNINRTLAEVVVTRI